MKEEKIKFYSLKNILKLNAIYNMIIGERSNGKTYSVHEYGLIRYIEHGEQMALIRRWGDDFKGKRGHETFSAICNNDLVRKYTKGKWTGIKYSSSRWFLCKYDEDLDKVITDAEPFCYGFSLNASEHDKSTSYPKITTILFDEFLTRDTYLTDEFVLFSNTISTIVRHRDNVKIFMLGNTVNKYSPYFDDMGLTNIQKMKQGTIDVYNYGESDLTVAVEYCETILKSKKSNKYFAFDNPKLKMITTGNWEIGLYPHLPMKYQDKDIKLTYFIVFYKDILQCEIIKKNKEYYTYIHRKTSDLKYNKRDIIFTCDFSTRPNTHRRITKPTDDVCRQILWFFNTERVFYQSNEVGEIVRNYMLWSKNDKGLL